MKRLTLIIMAGLLMLGLTQCKKEQTNTNANAEGEWVTITVKVDGGDRHIVYPGTGAVQYTDGDKIYVGNGGHYVGTLTYRSGAFSGEIQSPSTSDYLHFYFIGGEYTGSLTAGSTTSFGWSIADQSTKLPVLSYGHSTQLYSANNATYACTLENQCALVEFSLTNETNLAVTLGGMLTNASINFGTTPGITPTGTTGPITLYSENNTTKWAILLPKASETVTTATILGTPYDVTVPPVEANEYIHGTGNAVAIYNPVFSVGSNTTVHFAPGNLQATYNGSSWSWAFAANQWDYIGNATANTKINGNGSVSANGTVDLFGWVGKSASNTYNNLGINNSTSGDQYGNTANEALKKDWGNLSINNPKTGKADPAKTWRTLTNDEWNYLFNNAARGAKRYLIANITVANGNYNGVIVFPDNYDGSGLTGTYNYNENSPENWTNVSADDWSKMADAHAVFLPAAGHRNGTKVTGVNKECGYWSTSSSTATKAYYFSLGYDDFADEIELNAGVTTSRYIGQSVRLVCNVK